jgi:hypothetical protein
VVPVADVRRDVHRVWAVHAALVRHSLRHGFYQGWDLHPAHLISRYAAVYGFYLGGVEEAIARVTAWRRQAAGTDGVLDEPATIKSLEAQLRRAVACGALDESAIPVTWPPGSS